MKPALILAALVLLPATAAAGPDDWKGGAWLHYEATYVHRRDRAGEMAPPAAGDGIGLAGLRLRGFASRKLPVGYLAGLDLHAGSTNPGGFAYQVNLYLLGAGARLGKRGVVGLGSGVGASGAVGTLDDGVELPVEAFLELDLGSRLRLLARGRAVWLGAASARSDGSPTFAFTDEVDATLAIRFGRTYREFGFPSGNGYFLGAAYREQHGAQFVGAVLGYSVDVGSR
jgi:hypothetical protein